MNYKVSNKTNNLFNSIGYERSDNKYEKDDEIIYNNDKELSVIICRNGYFNEETAYGVPSNFSSDEIIVCAELAKELKNKNEQ